MASSSQNLGYPAPRNRPVRYVSVARPAPSRHGFGPGSIALTTVAILLTGILIYIINFSFRLGRGIRERVEAAKEVNRAAYAAKFAKDGHLGEHYNDTLNVMHTCRAALENIASDMAPPLDEVKQFCTHMGILPEAVQAELAQDASIDFDTDIEVREILNQQYNACNDAITRAEVAFAELDYVPVRTSPPGVEVAKPDLVERSKVLVGQYEEVLRSVLTNTREALGQVLRR